MTSSRELIGFIFFNCAKDDPLFDDNKKLKSGYFKDEIRSKIPQEVVGLRPKIYSILLWIESVKTFGKSSEYEFER